VLETLVKLEGGGLYITYLNMWKVGLTSKQSVNIIQLYKYCELKLTWLEASVSKKSQDIHLCNVGC